MYCSFESALSSATDSPFSNGLRSALHTREKQVSEDKNRCCEHLFAKNHKGAGGQTLTQVVSAEEMLLKGLKPLSFCEHLDVRCYPVHRTRARWSEKLVRIFFLSILTKTTPPTHTTHPRNAPQCPMWVSLSQRMRRSRRRILSAHAHCISLFISIITNNQPFNLHPSIQRWFFCLLLSHRSAGSISTYSCFVSCPP